MTSHFFDRLLSTSPSSHGVTKDQNSLKYDVTKLPTFQRPIFSLEIKHVSYKLYCSIHEHCKCMYNITPQSDVVAENNYTKAPWHAEFNIKFVWKCSTSKNSTCSEYFIQIFLELSNEVI